MSRKPFDGTPLDPAEARAIQAEITALTAYEAGIFFTLAVGVQSPVSGITRAIGPLRGVANYVVCAIDPHFPDSYDKARECAAAVADKASSLGLACRYIHNSFSPAKTEVTLRAGQKIMFLMAVGHLAGE